MFCFGVKLVFIDYGGLDDEGVGLGDGGICGYCMGVRAGGAEVPCDCTTEGCESRRVAFFSDAPPPFFLRCGEGGSEGCGLTVVGEL